jgi:hypothetical protein
MHLLSVAGFAAQSDGVLIFMEFGIRKTNGGHGTVNAFFRLRVRAEMRKLFLREP